MLIDTYVIDSNEDATEFDFVSIGPKGKIIKAVRYKKLASHRYMLGFGDYDEATDTIDDKAMSNNKDTIKVLSTVAQTLYEFFEKHPDAEVYVTGSTPKRTRIYNEIVSSRFPLLQRDFCIFGAIEDSFEDWQFGIDYQYLKIYKRTKQ